MPLTETQRRHLARRLQEERTRALRTLNRSVGEHADGDEQDRSGDLSVVPSHPADLGTDTMQAELDASNATRVSRELAEIEAAIERLHSTPEKYGTCEETGEDIPYERLDLIPWARTCGGTSAGSQSRSRASDRPDAR
ncbi:MAG TPA: TraR/DksA C4-type zinc finger protein [Gemmatimonadaceae bacterium]|nr:TraR/DksA C4-type zinc finger protein [Gemmatimonadaceae bacterium]